MLFRLYLILGLLCLSLSLKFTENDKLKEFIEYTKKFNKNYSSVKEFQHRFENWKKNYNKIKRLNPSSFSSTDKPKGARFTLNKFADLSQEEFAAKYLTLDPEMYRDLTPLTASDLGLDDVEPPENFDWEFDKNLVTKVKHQQDCGGCWSFATTSTLEYQYLLKYGEKITFSVQQLIDCDENNMKCSGGNMKKAFIYLKDHTLMEEKDYPFINGEGKCKYDESKGVIKVKEYSFVPKDEEEMKKALYKYGPLAGACDGMFIALYDGGVFDMEDFCMDTINHAIVIVGYGVDENGTKFWRIKNSYGEDWGENGYARLIRGKGLCGIKQYTLIAEIEKVK